MRKTTLFVSSLFMLSLASPAATFTLRTAPKIESDQAAKAAPLRAFQFSEETSAWQSKSTGRAVLYSLLLPGLGQRYLGEGEQAKIFFATEAFVWTSFVVFQVQGNLREDEYQRYAQVFAGVTSRDHSDDYYILLTQYDSSRDYEDVIKSEGRLILYPDVDAETLNRYFAENRISDYEPWEWRSVDDRRAYQDRRSASRRAYRRSLYAVAAGMANRVASAFFAYRSGRRASIDSGAQASRFRVQFDVPVHREFDELQTRVSVVRSF